MKLLFLGILACGWAEAAESVAPIQAERLRGEVLLIRGKKAERVTTEMALRAGDILRTGKEGSIRIVTTQARTDVAPYSTVRVGGVSELGLQYGHVRVVANKQVGSITSGRKPSFRIKTPAAVMGVRGTEFLVHVMRDEKEFSERLAGHLAEPPALKALEKLGSLPELYSQVCCLDGAVEVKPARTDKLVLKAGDITRIRGKQGDFAPSRSGVEEVRATRQAIGFPND